MQSGTFYKPTKTKTMNCPKCGDTTRKKMKGAVCTDPFCGWYTHDTSKFKVKLNGDMAQQFNEQQEEQYDPYDDPTMGYSPE
jgi:hypothetical protein